jgi:hypothetical protein
MTFIDVLIKLYQQVTNFLLPDRYFSWQTVIYMSLFSWLMSLIARGVGATDFTVTLLATFGWIFLALGAGWFVNHAGIRPFGIPIAPWVSGAILCVFLFGTLTDSWLRPALATWPLISFLVVAVPNLLGWDFQPKPVPPAVRQQLLLLFFLSLLFSSWFQFYFRIQSWLDIYPSLAADNLNRSTFVYRLPGQPAPVSAGVAHLSTAETILQSELGSKPWSSTERWLANLNGQQQYLQQEIHRIHGHSSEEAPLWRFGIPNPTSNGDGYTLELQAIWVGPSAYPSGYYLEKTCEVMPVRRGNLTSRSNDVDWPASTQTPQTTWTSLDCKLETPRFPGPPSG